jgi:hypothetical protein
MLGISFDVAGTPKFAGARENGCERRLSKNATSLFSMTVSAERDNVVQTESTSTFG